MPAETPKHVQIMLRTFEYTKRFLEKAEQRYRAGAVAEAKLNLTSVRCACDFLARRMDEATKATEETDADQN